MNTTTQQDTQAAANKAEVDLPMFDERGPFYELFKFTVGSLAVHDFKEADEIGQKFRALLATPPATTGASTAPANANPVSEREIAELRKLVGYGGVYAAEFADSEQLMASFWSIIGQLNKQLESKPVGASTASLDGDRLYAAWHKVGADVAGLKFADFMAALGPVGASTVLTDECIVRKPTPAVQAPAGFDERESLIWNMGRSSVEQLAIEPVAFMYQDDQDLTEPGTGSCVVSKARCNFYRNETPLYAVNLAAQAAKELTESELSQIILKRTNPIAAEKYGDTFLRIAQAVQREVLARIGQHVAREVAAQAGQVAVPSGWIAVARIKGEETSVAFRDLETAKACSIGPEPMPFLLSEKDCAHE